MPEDNPKLIEMGIKQKCVANTKCTHDYCGKYKWVLERAKHYAEKTGKTVEEVMEIWENDRTYWYSESIINYEDWLAELKNRFGNDAKKWAFKCPSCNNVQTAQDFIDNGSSAKTTAIYTHIGAHVTSQIFSPLSKIAI